MSIPGAASPLFLATAAGPAGDFEVSRSLRFDRAAQSYLNRTPSSAGNRKTFTFSCWHKKSGVNSSNRYILFNSYTSGSVYFSLEFETEKLKVFDGGAISGGLATDAVFRDPSAWYHIVCAVDTTDGTASNRVKLYVNGVQQTLTGTQPSQNSDLGINTTTSMLIGAIDASGIYHNLDGYLAEVNFVNAAALGPTSFGQADSDGVWRPKDTAGLSFGTNGFRLKFADNSSNAALGTDSSGNSNTWTVNNLIATAGVIPNQGFDAVTYTGNGGTQSISSLAFQPDFVWLKGRSQSNVSHQLYDSVRGVSKILQADNTGNEFTVSGVSAFNSNGFTLGDNGGGNNSGSTYVAWAWKAGGAASSNTDGTITSQVSANNTYGFSIVTASASSAGDTIGHGLNVSPSLIIAKRTNATSHWPVYHSSVGANGFTYLNLTNAAGTGSDFWNNVTPTSSVFTVGSDSAVSGGSAVFYCWSEVAGFSKFGSVSAGSDPIVTTGFKPHFVIVKRSDAAGNWNIFDTARGSGTTQIWLEANSSGPENNHVNGQFKFLDDGFQLIGPDIDVGTVLYMAFAETGPSPAGIDSLVDTPSNAAEPTDTGVGNEVVGNYCTWNPVQPTFATTSFSNGNLDCSLLFTNGSATPYAVGNFVVSSGKWYWEITLTQESNDTEYIGIISGSKASGAWAFADVGAYFSDARKAIGAFPSSYGTSYTTGDVIGIALDADNGNLTFYKNGVSQGAAATGMTVFNGYKPFTSSNGTSTAQLTAANFGQRAFAYTAPSGYKSLNTANLPTPTIADGSLYFDTKLWTGTGSSRSVTGYSFSPDWVWIKKRSGSTSHNLFDAVRGANRPLFSDQASQELSDGRLTAFNSDGFTLDSDNAVNDNNQTHVGWAWDGGTSTVTNNDGSIASQVRANPSAGFSIVSYTGNNSAGASIGHGLNTAPEFIVCKDRDSSSGWWAVYAASQGNTKGAYLNDTQAFGTQSFWNNTTPTSSVFSVGANANTNASGNGFIAYCFAPVAGYSAIGSYTGNGSSDGPFIHTGFKVAFLLLKCTNATELWMLHDSARDPDNVVSKLLQPHTSDAEIDSVTNYGVDFLSNGFKFRSSSNRNNGSGNTYIYMAFAENPFQANGGLAR